MGYKLTDIREKLPKHPTRKWQQRSFVDTIVVHTTASDNQDPKKTALYHITPSTPKGKNHISDKGCPALCYSDFITKDGTVYHCNNYTDITWHAGLYNKRSVGIVMAYKGQDNDYPTDKQIDSLEQHIVILCLYLKVKPNRVIGHREVPGMFTILGNGSKKYKKICPGNNVDLDILRKNITFRLQRRLASEGLYKGNIDGLFGIKSITALLAFKPSNKG